MLSCFLMPKPDLFSKICLTEIFPIYQNINLSIVVIITVVIPI